ncbi:MAG: M20/M25/M40 family metallo-hydrolase [Pirellulales bacterium]
MSPAKKSSPAKTAKSRKSSSVNAAALPISMEPDAQEALNLVMELMAIPGKSGEEGRIWETIRKKLRKTGVPDAATSMDNAHQKSPLKGEVGNLILKLPGTLKGPRRLLMAHLDTVPLCVGCQPVQEGEFVRSADPKTGLGADDRAGAATILTAALNIVRRKLPHPPLTFLWVVQEEVGLHGSQFVQQSKLGGPKLAFNWDGGAPEKVTVGATGAYRLSITLTGLASHAGVAPEKGVSAIALAGVAIARLHREGWLGLVQKDVFRGTSNIGWINGGGATNVITDRVELKAEARSHDSEFRKLILTNIEQAFRDAAIEVRSVTGAAGSVQVESRLDYESFVLNSHEPCVAAVEAAIRSIGGEPTRVISNGGLDANWMSAHGIPTVTMGCGQMDVHTVNERLDIAAYQRACRIALRLAVGRYEV